jgi:hypothetical protein
VTLEHRLGHRVRVHLVLATGDAAHEIRVDRLHDHRVTLVSSALFHVSTLRP